MSKSTYQIGEKEKHTLTIERDHLMKKDIIKLDGELLTEKFSPWPGERKYSYEIGSAEKHKVEVGVGKFEYPTVLVDGKSIEGSSD
jgi:hypothetical protein